MNYDWQQEVRSGESEVLWPSEWSCIYVRSRVAGSSAQCTEVWHMFKFVCLSRAELAHINESLKCLCQTQAARLSSWLHQFFIDHHQHEVLHLAFYVSL